MATFDLRSEQQAVRRSVKTNRAASIGCSVGAGAVGAYFVLSGLRMGRDELGAILGGLAGLFAVLFGWNLWATGPIWDNLTVDEAGITLSISGGRSFRLDWSDPDFSLSSLSSEGVHDRLSKGKAAQGLATQGSSDAAPHVRVRSPADRRALTWLVNREVPKPSPRLGKDQDDCQNLTNLAMRR